MRTLVRHLKKNWAVWAVFVFFFSKSVEVSIDMFMYGVVSFAILKHWAIFGMLASIAVFFVLYIQDRLGEDIEQQ